MGFAAARDRWPLDSRRALRQGRRLSSALDTNILAYAEGVRSTAADDAKIITSRTLMQRLDAAGEEIYLAAQVLVETHNLLTRRLALSRTEAMRRIGEISRLGTIVPTTEALLKEAFQLSAKHNIHTFDAIILAAAAEARCDVIYSEDMQHGFVWRGVEIVNPFR